MLLKICSPTKESQRTGYITDYGIHYIPLLMSDHKTWNKEEDGIPQIFWGLIQFNISITDMTQKRNNQYL